MAYPTYLVGAKIAGCRAVACDDLDQLGDARPALVWINSPSNPTGQILDAEALKHRVNWARERGSLVASDECYGEFGWEAEPISVLHPRSMPVATTACSPCTRSPNAPTWPATAPGSSLVIESGGGPAGGSQACRDAGASSGSGGDDRPAR